MMQEVWHRVACVGAIPLTRILFFRVLKLSLAVRVPESGGLIFAPYIYGQMRPRRFVHLYGRTN
jgi:hypothetical protein